MTRTKNNEFTMVVPGLSKSQAINIRNSYKDVVKKVAPNSRNSMAIGHKKNMEQVVSRCLNGLGQIMKEIHRKVKYVFEFFKS